MNRAQFKAWERRIAEQMGGKRIPVTGRHNKETPDIDHPDFAIEVKARSTTLKGVMRDALEQASEAGRAHGKTPCVVQVFTGGQGRSAERLVTFRLDDFTEMLDRAYRTGLEMWQ